MTDLGVQLHTFRTVELSLVQKIHRIADHGFDGVEFAHQIHDADIRAVRGALSETGLESIAAHVGLSRLESDFDSLLRQYEAIDCYRLVVPHAPSHHFLTIARIDAFAARINRLADRLGDHGFELAVHNSRGMHRPILDNGVVERLVEAGVCPVGGAVLFAQALNWASPAARVTDTGFGRFVDMTESGGITFEIDVEHAIASGCDPHDLFELTGDRLFAVHLSDGTGRRWRPNAFQSVDLGDGEVNIERDIDGAVRYAADWLIGEVDHPSDAEAAFQDIADTIGPHYTAVLRTQRAKTAERTSDL